MNNEISSKEVLKKVEEVVQVCKGDTCTICVKQCVMLREYMKSPKSFFSELLENQRVNPLIPFSCTQCGYCAKICPENIILYEVFKSMKKELQEKSKIKPVLKSHYGVYFHQKLSQTKFVKGYKKGNYQRAFMPGCSLSAYSPVLVEKTFDYLKSLDSAMGSITSCCHKPLQDLGHFDAFKTQVNQFSKEISDKGINEIIVGCQNCYESLKKEHPEINIITIWHIFDDKGLPKESNKNRKIANTYVIHDPCPAEKSPEIKKIIRRLVSELGYEVKKNDKSFAKCCGLGAMAGSSNAELTQKVTNERIEALDGKKIINYCAACTEAMGQGNKESYHLLELIFNKPINGKNSTVKKWMNRYETKQKIT